MFVMDNTTRATLGMYRDQCGGPGGKGEAILGSSHEMCSYCRETKTLLPHVPSHEMNVQVRGVRSVENNGVD